MKNRDKHIDAPIIHSCLVTPKGAAKAIMGGAVLGVAGSAVKAASDTVANQRSKGTSPLARGAGSLGLLALTDEHIVLLDGRRGMLGPVATNEAGRIPRAELAEAELGSGKLAAPLRLTWADGSSWELEVPRKYVKDARSLVADAKA